MSAIIKSLITSGLLVKDTVVTAKVSQHSKYGTVTYQYRDMIIDKINNDTDDYMVLLTDVYSTMPILLSIDNITSIEGMSPDRYADVYNINIDGSNRQIGKKRGRKPKVK